MENHDHDTQSEIVSRRNLIQRVGLSAGGALIAGATLASSARAQDAGMTPDPAMPAGGTMPAGEMMPNQPLAPGDLAMTPRMMGEAMPNTPPEDAIIPQIENPGAKEANDVAILNYALVLEFLEAEFYTQVVAADEARAFLRGRPKDVARILMRDETVHVATVSDAITKLGGTPVAKPQFQFPAEAFISQIAFLSTSASLEETGVSAYLGQGANVRRKDVLDLAASIYGNEARHTALIRYLLGDNFAPRDRELPLSMGQILTRVRPFIISGMPNMEAMGAMTAPNGGAEMQPQPAAPQ